ncbi:MAG: hypothetical protein A3I04_00030 [Nitrospinae bacterium RIFCSPLOWO2_02_FULL_39_110]|nr:MAG: hypothetical protein A2W53_04045 [Nitrospinae bacterium RIFCSPHIGHO2_02_39_11]OGW05669.1 MAG: hypothetical protein A3I04_00030 [Nitrospinae bacterium RIFCSPLOWO2_02_FULL_39_110]OGW08079.1 MAG: hypothetical protein A2W75_06745 [Nitrospinae bacterium RIFCSPLOWO2_12_39_15]
MQEIIKLTTNEHELKLKNSQLIKGTTPFNSPFVKGERRLFLKFVNIYVNSWLNQVLVLSLIFLIAGNVTATERGHYRYSPFKHIEIMESPERALWQMPEKVVDYLAIKNGDAVADIGAGSGYFTVLFSKSVGEDGKVYAVDIEKGMIDYIEKRGQKEGLNNIKTILSKLDDPLLSKSSIDMIFICNTYLVMKNREDYLKILMEVLKKYGRLAIVDYQAVDTPMGPPVKMRVSREKVMEEALKAGFKLEAEYYFLPYQYFLVFAKG